MITLPNLDDRRYADLVEEARSLLVAHAPALTDHNPSDPAITLMELFAYVTEALLFRVNSITDANRVKFLQLLNGPDWPVPDSREGIDAQVRSTVLALRSTDRAVTAADFEFLARAADARVARAHCLPGINLEAVDPDLRQQPAHVSVVIVPQPTADLESLRKAVSDYLEPRRLLTARVHVVGPRVVPIRVRMTLRLLPEAPEKKMKQRTLDALRSFLDPIAGGADGSGWPFGRSVYVSELYRLLDTLPGVDFVRRTLDPSSSAPLDELVTTPDLADRLVRNSAGELISVALNPEELVELQVPSTDGDVDTDLVIEEPPTSF
jgi:hypothetical protein